MTSFQENVFQVLRKIPKGKVSTYALLANASGYKKSYRAIGNALKKNEDIPNTPCHRIVRSDGGIGGYVHGVNKKKKILKEEGVLTRGDKIVNFNKVLFNFK